MHELPAAGTYTAPAAGQARHWVEHLRSAALSAGTYCLPAGGTDPQGPHTEDEVYVVLAGRARLAADSGSVPVRPGSVLFVPAGEAHRFVDITEDLTVLVLFAPPEGSTAP